MSIEALRWALEDGEARSLEPGQRHVLLILGNRADERGFCYPSIAWICKRTGMKRRTVQAHMKALEDLGVLRRDQRATEQGGRTSDAIWLGLRQPGLPLPDPRADFALGGAGNDTTPVQILHPPRADPAPNTQDKKKEKKSKVSGQADASPVTALFRTYQAGIRRLYAAEYPPSAKANGQLANVVKQLGADRAGQALGYYLGSAKPYYATRKHALDVFIRDAADLCIAMQQASGGRVGPAPTEAIAYIEHSDGERARITEYPVGEPFEIAKTFAREYASKVNRQGVTSVMVRIGNRECRWKLEELR